MPIQESSVFFVMYYDVYCDVRTNARLAPTVNSPPPYVPLKQNPIRRPPAALHSFTPLRKVSQSGRPKCDGMHSQMRSRSLSICFSSAGRQASQMRLGHFSINFSPETSFRSVVSNIVDGWGSSSCNSAQLTPTSWIRCCKMQDSLAAMYIHIIACMPLLNNSRPSNRNLREMSSNDEPMLSRILAVSKSAQQ